LPRKAKYSRAAQARTAVTVSASDYYLAHLPTDHAPPWDVDVPVATGPRALSAAAIAAFGLLRLAALSADPIYAQTARETLRALGTGYMPGPQSRPSCSTPRLTCPRPGRCAAVHVRAHDWSLHYAARPVSDTKKDGRCSREDLRARTRDALARRYAGGHSETCAYRSSCGYGHGASGAGRCAGHGAHPPGSAAAAWPDGAGAAQRPLLWPRACRSAPSMGV
jgi:hypothetical protein